MFRKRMRHLTTALQLATNIGWFEIETFEMDIKYIYNSLVNGGRKSRDTFKERRKNE